MSRRGKPIRKKKKPVSRSKPWLWALIAGALLAVVGGIVVLGQSSNSASPEAPQVTGAPRLAIEQDVIDEGYIKLGETIRTTFHLKNVGDQPLQIMGEPQVELVEGC